MNTKTNVINDYKQIANSLGYKIELTNNITGEVRISDGLHRITIYTTTGTIAIYNYIDKPEYHKHLSKERIYQILKNPLTI